MGETFNQFLELIKNNTTFAIIVVAIFVTIMFLSLTIIFYKIKVEAWKGLIPIYNVMTLIDTLGIPVWMIFVMLIPFVNIVGIPVMMIIIGWKLGNYCRKGILMKLGLCLLPPLFIPILALCYIDIDGTGDYELVPVELPKGFSLDAVEVSMVDTNISAMSLTDMGVMDRIAPPTVVRETSTPKVEGKPKKQIKELDIGPANNEVEDLNRVLPTADDLTFDYNSLYKSSATEEKIEPVVEEEVFPDAKELEVPKEESSTIDYNSLYAASEPTSTEGLLLEQEETEIPEETVVEELEEEEPTIIIHDVVLEAAEPITEGLGPVPINRRYDFQKNQKETFGSSKNQSSSMEEKVESQLSMPIATEVAEEPNIQEINPLAPPVISPISVSPTVEVETTKITQPLGGAIEEKDTLPMQAANPFGEGSLPSLADVPELTLPTAETIDVTEVPEVNISDFAMQGLRQQEVIEAGTRVDQIVSMNIAEPSQLPVGVLTKAPGKVADSEPVPVEPEIVPAPVQQAPQVSPTMTREEAMGIRQTFFSDVLSNNSFGGPSVNQPSGMMPQTNIFMSSPVVNMQQPAISQPMNIPQNMQQPMNYGNPNMSTVPSRQMNFQQPVEPTAIFQANTSGGSLLRPVESNLPPTEKNCPVCGVKLKPECPICIMCGFKF